MLLLCLMLLLLCLMLLLLLRLMLLLGRLVALALAGTCVSNRLHGGCHHCGKDIAVQSGAPFVGRLVLRLLLAGADQDGRRTAGHGHFLLIVMGEHGGCRRGRFHLKRSQEATRVGKGPSVLQDKLNVPRRLPPAMVIKREGKIKSKRK